MKTSDVAALQDPMRRHVQAAIIGTGFGGLGTAIRLKQEGMQDFVVFERASQVGGVWRDNSYPGCACDVQSHLYSFSFAPNPHWSRRFSPQAEVWKYLQQCAIDFEIRPHIRFEHEVLGATWHDADAHWRIETSQGFFTASVLVAAPGALAEPRLPELPGLEHFKGPVFHSARWDEKVNLKGRRVAVVGTGASAIQIVPAIQPIVQRLVLFQRTPPWVVPRHDRALSSRVSRWLERIPVLNRGLRSTIYGMRELLGIVFRHPQLARLTERTARRHLRRQVADPVLRRKLTPDYTMGCKRILLSDDYYPALTRQNVEVVDGGAVEARPGGIVGSDGVERPVDVIVFSTGFHVTDFPFAGLVRGKDGDSLEEVWGPSPRAHLGTTVAGFPNLFILQGPNTGLGHSSVVLMIEAQIEHVVGALRFMEERGIAAVEPRPEAQSQFVREVDAMMEGTVWTTGGCKSWYLDETGRNSTLWPGSVGSFRRRVQRFRPGEYLLRPAPTVSSTRQRATAGA